MIKPLTSLRFFFAFCVFLCHVGPYFTNNSFLEHLNNSVFYEGYLGVSFFFILSGFILSLNYQTKLATGQITFKEFWIARIARIYPLHFITLLVAIPLTISLKITMSWFGALIANLLLVQSFIPVKSIYFSFNAPSWSISDELFFYSLFPLIIGWQKFKGAYFFNIILLLLIPIGIFFLPERLDHPLFYINPIFRIMDFSLGILLYKLYDRINKTNTRLMKRGTLFELFSIVLFVVFFIFHSYIQQAYRFSCYYWIPMSAIIFVFAFQSGLFSKLLSNKLLILLGEISFSFYLLHQLFIKYITGINHRFAVIQNNFLLFMIIFIVSLVASYFSYKFIEHPLNKYIKQRYLKKNKPHIAS